MNKSNNQISLIKLPMLIKTVPIGKVLHKHLLNFFANFTSICLMFLPGVTYNSLAYKKAKK